MITTIFRMNKQIGLHVNLVTMIQEQASHTNNVSRIFVPKYNSQRAFCRESDVQSLSLKTFSILKPIKIMATNIEKMY